MQLEAHLKRLRAFLRRLQAFGHAKLPVPSDDLPPIPDQSPFADPRAAAVARATPAAFGTATATDAWEPVKGGGDGMKAMGAAEEDSEFEGRKALAEAAPMASVQLEAPSIKSLSTREKAALQGLFPKKFLEHGKWIPLDGSITLRRIDGAFPSTRRRIEGWT